MKSENTEVSEKTLGILKFELAGKIVEKVSEQMATQKELDFAKNEAKKAQEEVGVIVADKPHQFDGVLEAVEKLEEVLKSTSKEVAVPPASKESPVSPAEATNPVLELLRQAIELISAQNLGGQKSPNEVKAQDADQNGEAGAAAVIARTEKTEDMIKIEAELTEMKEKLEKLSNEPEPVRIKTGYTVIEKFENTGGELEKAEARSLELQELLKKNPSDQALIKEASELGTRIMSLKRAS